MWATKFLCLVLAVVALWPEGYQGQMSRSLNFHAARVKYSPKYFSNFTLQVINNSLFVDMTVKQPLTAGFTTNLDFQFRLANSKAYQSLIRHTVDACSVVLSLKDSIFKKWFKSTMKYGNFMDNCPVDVGRYYLNGWTLDSTLIPSYLYPGDYRVGGYGYYGKFKSKKEIFVVDCEVDLTIV